MNRSLASMRCHRFAWAAVATVGALLMTLSLRQAPARPRAMDAGGVTRIGSPTAPPAARPAAAARTVAVGAPTDGDEDATANPAWMAEVRARVAATEYAFRLEARVARARNHAQAFDARVDGRGLSLTTDDPSESTLRLGAASMGRTSESAGAQSPRRLAAGSLALGACRTDGAVDEHGACIRRLEVDRGDAVEVWENRPDGIEHSLVIPVRPHGAGDLVAFVDVDGAHVTVAPDGQSAHLALGTRTLRYEGLVVKDAGGSVLRAHLETAPGGLAIHVADAAARYPVVIDPVLSNTYAARLTPGIGLGANAPVTGVGDVDGDGYGDVVLGAPSYVNGHGTEGAAYLFRGSPSGPETTAAWSFESDAPSANFGTGVAGAGDLNGDGFDDVVVGAPFFGNGQSAEGAAYVFYGSASGLAASPDVLIESNATNAWFGRSVSSAGDVDRDGYADMLVGAWFFENGQTTEGAAFLYAGSATGVSSTPTWRVEGNLASAGMGSAVARAGDVNADGYDDVVIGASGYSAGQSSEGRAFLFLGSSSGLAPTAVWTAESDQANAAFGGSVAGAGDVNADGFADVVVGAMGYAVSATNEGRAYAYHGTATGLSTTAAWTKRGGFAQSRFGSALAGAGDVNGDGFSDVLVGAREYSGGEMEEGRAELYLGSASGLETSPDWQIESNSPYARLGYSVASAGDVNGDGLADAILYLNVNGGSADVYLGGWSRPGFGPGFTADVNQVAANAGTSVAYVGDVNGDGFGDLLAGAPGYANGHVGEGRALLYFGSSTGVNTTVGWTFECDQIGARCGAALAGTGDVNGDGFADIAVGAPGFDTVLGNVGRVFAFLGSASGPGASPVFTGEGAEADDAFGSALAGAGDVNGDGYTDLVVGQPLDPASTARPGSAALFSGSASGLVATPAWTGSSGVAGDRFGAAVGGAGDVNGDGYADVVVGANRVSNGQANEGAVFGYYGSATGVASVPAWRVESNTPGGELGASVAVVGDIDADGYADVVVGVPGFGAVVAGGVFVYHGGPSGLESTDRLRVTGPAAAAQFGRAVSPSGDVNGDGYGDFLVGAPGYESARLYFGSATGTVASNPWTYFNSTGGIALFGTSVGGGDLTGDGFADVLVGAPAFDGAQTNSGRSFAFYGAKRVGGPTTIARKPRIQRPASNTQVQPWTRTPDVAWDVAVVGHTPYGRMPLALEVEAKRRGVPFDGLGTTTTGWMYVTPTTDVVTSLVGVAGADYHLRYRFRFHPAAGTPLHSTPWQALAISGDAPGVHLRTRRGAMGEVCVDGAGCPGGACVDGVCCDTACGFGSPDDCTACSVAAGATVDGTCGTVTAAAMHACRPSGGDCDVAERCDGVSPTCPSDTLVAAATVCRAASDSCDAPETCTGTDAACPPPGAPLPNGSVCRPADPTRPCDASETCNGATANCPPDTFVPLSSNTVCRPAVGPCDVPEFCAGDSMDCTAVDAVRPANSLCNLKTGLCDDDDYCDGASTACPNRLQPDGWPCDDQLVCTQASSCRAGACTATVVLDCSDADACTTDSCVEPTGCMHSAVPACLLDAGALDAGRDAGGDGGSTPTPQEQAGCSCRAAGSDPHDVAGHLSVLLLVVAVGMRRARRLLREA